jgi:cell division protein FtsB
MELMKQYLNRANLTTALGAFIAIYLLVILGGVVKRNHDLQVQINGLNSQITQLKTQETQLNYDIAYYQTDAFKEKEARAKLGLVAPGESVVLLPPEQSSSSSQSATHSKPPAKSHIAQWFSFLFGT